jgi:hypothetical protein
MVNPLTPYLMWIKAGAALLIASAIFAGGCRVQANRDASKLEAKAHELMVCQFDRGALADALNAVNARAEQARRDAAAQAEHAAEAVRQADKDRAAYEKRIDGIASDLAKAKRAPACRAQLEQPLCVELH